MRKVFVVVIGCSLLCGCSVTKHKLPLNYVDKPAVLPKGMVEHPVQFDKSTYDIGKVGAYYIIPVVSGVVGMNRGLKGNWEQHSWLPIFTYLFGENKYYELNRIEYNKWHHLVTFGLSGLSYSSRDGWSFQEILGYQNIYVGHGNYRNHASLWFSLLHEKELRGYELSTQNEVTSKWSKRLSGSLVIGGSGLWLYGNESQSILSLEPWYQREYSAEDAYKIKNTNPTFRMTEFLGFGLQYGLMKNLSFNGYYQMSFSQVEGWSFIRSFNMEQRIDYWKFTANVVW